jgi:hypothetical protein
MPPGVSLAIHGFFLFLLDLGMEAGGDVDQVLVHQARFVDCLLQRHGDDVGALQRRRPRVKSDSGGQHAWGAHVV